MEGDFVVTPQFVCPMCSFLALSWLLDTVQCLYVSLFNYLYLKDFNIAEDDAKLSFLNQPLTNGSSVKEEVLEDTFEKKLMTLLSQQDVNQVFNLVENKFGSGQS